MLQAKILCHLGEVEPDPICRAFTRYSCRCCTSQGISQLYGLDLTPRQRDGIRALKDWIDYSHYRNQLYGAIWTLGQYKKPQYSHVARQRGLDPEELQYQFRLLGPEDQQILQAAPEPQGFTHQQINQTIDAVSPYLKRTVKQYLRYSYQNDGGTSKQDFWADLVVQGIRVIRNYEVLGLTVQQMIPLVARGIGNHTKNLAAFHGKDRRNPLLRLEHRNETRLAWYCNVSAEHAEQCRVYTAPKHRQGEYYLAEFPGRPAMYIYAKRLFDTHQEADSALLEYLHGRGHKRSVVVDLTTTLTDDWCPVSASLDTPCDDGAPLLDFLPDRSEPQDISTEDVLQDVTDPKTRLFCHAVLGDLGSMFDDHCIETTGKSSAELSVAQISRVARRYCGVSTQQLTEAVQPLHP